MATTSMTTSQANTVKKFNKMGWVSLIHQTAFGFISSVGGIYDASADFRGNNGKGDNVTFDYTNRLTNVPLGEGSTAFGNEEALNIGSHNMSINLTRIPVANPNVDTIEQQRTNIDFAETAAKQCYGRAAELIDFSTFNQLAGVNPTSFTLLDGATYSGNARLMVQGHNAPTAPTANRHILAAAAATDQALTSADTFSLDLLDYANETMMSAGQPMAPANDGFYHVFLHPYQVVDLKHDNSNAIQWLPIQLAEVQGGKESKLILPYSDKPTHVASYGRFKLYEAPRVAFGANSSTGAVITTVRRAVIVGRDALSFASPFGGINMSKDTRGPFKMYDQLADYEYIRGIDMRGLYGIKKMSPSNADDIGSFVISTYAAAHS